ncbi:MULTISPECIES: exosortase C-terminal domain/associated protein EpsI [Acidobacteriaceae]|uniref:exosortase C-terminal domain/associated protein EpsI n=1 Tax=Acidobacteriaceae TaxID=204434 RepID=UPI00131AE63C|nr:MULTISPECIES: exosortase C-terminal domain/associated protein EpsI [Acidobacteriaceae]MDW5267484.1 EpsI family protein [Edaphobacter sp.]
MKSPKFWTVVLLLVVTALILHSRGDTDRVPPSEPLKLMPETIGSWTAQDLPIADDVLSVLGKGDFLNRIYTSSQPVNISQTSEPVAANLPIGLFIGYFPTQRTGQTMHSPQNCLPGAGWTFDSRRYINLKDVNGKSYRVGEYQISNGEIRQFVIYWYQAHGRSIPNEYVARAYMVADAIRLDRTDGALVRVITQIAPTETVADARERAVHFTSLMAPMLSRFIPN